jgi:hypothetical protein
MSSDCYATRSETAGVCATNGSAKMLPLITLKSDVMYGVRLYSVKRVLLVRIDLLRRIKGRTNPKTL